MAFFHDIFTDDNDYWSLTRILTGLAFVVVTGVIVGKYIDGNLSDGLVQTYFGLFGTLFGISKGLDRVRPVNK